MARRLSAAWLGTAIVLLLIAAPSIYSDGARALADVFLLTEDLPVLLALSLAAAALLILSGPRGAVGRDFIAVVDRWRPKFRPSPWPLVLALAIGAFLVSWLGARFALAGFPLSMDEFMAGFDAEDISPRSRYGARIAILAASGHRAAADVHPANAGKPVLGLGISADERGFPGPGRIACLGQPG